MLLLVSLKQLSLFIFEILKIIEGLATMKKENKIDKSTGELSAKWSNLFYIASLLILSIYQYIKTGTLGTEFIILMIGLVLFFLTYFIKNKS